MDLAQGEEYMRDRLDEAFNVGVTEQFSLSKVPTAELSAALSKVTAGVRKSEDLVNAINRGNIGATTPRGQAGLGKLGKR